MSWAPNWCGFSWLLPSSMLSPCIPSLGASRGAGSKCWHSPSLQESPSFLKPHPGQGWKSVDPKFQGTLTYPGKDLKGDMVLEGNDLSRGQVKGIWASSLVGHSPCPHFMNSHIPTRDLWKQSWWQGEVKGWEAICQPLLWYHVSMLDSCVMPGRGRRSTVIPGLNFLPAQQG